MNTNITKQSVNKRARRLAEKWAGIRSEFDEVQTLAGEFHADMGLHDDDEMTRAFLYGVLSEIDNICMPEEIEQMPDVAWDEPKLRMVK